MPSSAPLNCPLCDLPIRDDAERIPIDAASRDALYLSCDFCGDYVLTRNAYQILRNQLEPASDASRVLSYVVRRAQESQDWPMFGSDQVNKLLGTGKLPSLSEAADNLLLWLGENTEPGRNYHVEYAEVGAVVGLKSEGALLVVLEGLAEQGLLDLDTMIGSVTYRGWIKYDELRSGTPTGHGAFMAMQFGDAELDGIMENVFRPAVAATGFQLRRLDDEPRAGLIDDRMRVEIRNARFLIADVSHGNRGAYWEAGFAEGLGKPVIYTCKREVFESREHEFHPHFDTNHHLTVIWNSDDPDQAARDLKATIRATLPESKQRDDPPES